MELTAEHLLKKLAEYKQLAERHAQAAVASQGAATAIEVLLRELTAEETGAEQEQEKN